jgi:hypothetical protein
MGFFNRRIGARAEKKLHIRGKERREMEIAGYCRISVDEELDQENTSIENQKMMIADFIRQHFPEAGLTFFEDRDRSGYTFEQREGLSKAARRSACRAVLYSDCQRFFPVFPPELSGAL